MFINCTHNRFILMLKNTLLLTMVLSFVYCSVRPTAPVSIKEITQVYNLPWYSGYLDVDNDTKHMHYFYFPSQNDAKLDPLLFWFNGGPGCSSLLGALYEHGPFLINDAFGIYMNNPFAWNKRANVVYIESPAQVGFSYMDTDPITWNDEIVAELNLQAVVDFFVVWPEFNDRSTYIAG